MAARDIGQAVTLKPSLNAAARTATANGLTVDTAGFGGGCQAATFYVVTGAYTDGTHTLKAQESTDDSVWADVAAGDLDGTFAVIAASGDANKVLSEVNYRGGKRYVRAVTTVTGATTGAVYGAYVLLGSARVGPIA